MRERGIETYRTDQDRCETESHPRRLSSERSNTSMDADIALQYARTASGRYCLNKEGMERQKRSSTRIIYTSRGLKCGTKRYGCVDIWNADK